MNGKKLRELRRASGKTLRQISFESGVTEQAILNAEVNRHLPRIDTLLAICKAIGCSISDVVDEDVVANH